MSRLLDETEAGAAAFFNLLDEQSTSLHGFSKGFLDLHIQSVATPLSRTWYVDASGEVARLSKAELTLTDLNLECLLDIELMRALGQIQS